VHRFLSNLFDKQAEIVALIREMVECESPSGSPPSINQFVDLLIERTRGIADPQIIPAPDSGNHLRLEFRTRPDTNQSQTLALGHSDTVWPLGTLKQMPFRNADGRLWGPGVLDMKAGIALFLYAVRTLIELEIPTANRVVLLVVSDEEIGSKTSRAITEAEARRSESVLVLEPGTGLSGKLKTARKGVGRYIVAIEGKASHAGVDFENGASAILEAAHQLQRIASFTDLKRGTTVNPGVIGGGTRSNVIAAEARIDVDVRVSDLEAAEAIDTQLRSLTPFDTRCRVRIEGGLNRPPMERTAAIAALFAKAKRVAADLGIRLEESSTGGGSDGNFTAALGIPTLDGLGAVGEGAHAPNESILLDRIPGRAALLAGILRSH
jgi:glutamate carboxypeptidase